MKLSQHDVNNISSNGIIIQHKSMRLADIGPQGRLPNEYKKWTLVQENVNEVYWNYVQKALRGKMNNVFGDVWRRRRWKPVYRSQETLTEALCQRPASTPFDENERIYRYSLTTDSLHSNPQPLFPFSWILGRRSLNCRYRGKSLMPASICLRSFRSVIYNGRKSMKKLSVALAVKLIDILQLSFDLCTACIGFG